MQNLSVRINEILSEIQNDENMKNMIKSMCACDSKKQLLSIIAQKFKCSANESLQVVELSLQNQQNNTSHNKKTTKPYHLLTKKATKIMNKQGKLNESSKFNGGENLGYMAQLQLEIGIDINELNIDHLSGLKIDLCVDKIIDVKKRNETINSDMNMKHNTELLSMSVASFFQTIRNKNKKKLQNKSNTNKSNNNTTNENKLNENINVLNENNCNKNKKNKRISNNISHMAGTKYAQLIQCESDHNNILLKLTKLKDELLETARTLGIFDAYNKCPQESRWTNAVNNNNMVCFKGKNAFNRIKSMLKDIKNSRKKCMTNLKILKNLMNGAIWKKEGRLRSKKTMRERAEAYEKEKENRAQKRPSKKRKQENEPEQCEPPKKRQKMLSSFWKR